MATKTLKGKFLPQYRTAAQWSAANPVLLAGEIGIESDTRKFKFGDGATAWNSLGYAGSGGDSAERLSGALEITDFADFPDTTVFEKPGDIVPIRVEAGDNSPNESSGQFVGTAQAWERWVSGGAENQIVYSVIDTESGKAYSGRTTGAGGSIQWVASGGGVKGLLESVKLLTTSFWNLISSNDTDIQAFVVGENSPEVPAEYKGEGFGFARHYRDDVGMATVTIKLNSGKVKTFNVTFYGDGSDAYWEETGGSSGSSLPFDGPIPGYELIYSDTTTGLELQNGVVAQFNFDKEIPSTQLLLSKSRLMVEAVIVSKSGSTQTIAASVPIAIIKPTLNNNIVFEYVAPTIASGSTSIPRVKLIITSWIRSGAYMTGCNVLLQVSNANASMGYHLMLQGVYVKSSGGGQ